MSNRKVRRHTVNAMCVVLVLGHVACGQLLTLIDDVAASRDPKKKKKKNPPLLPHSTGSDVRNCG
jgi:hypothetical protein